MFAGRRYEIGGLVAGSDKFQFLEFGERLVNIRTDAAGRRVRKRGEQSMRQVVHLFWRRQFGPEERRGSIEHYKLACLQVIQHRTILKRRRFQPCRRNVRRVHQEPPLLIKQPSFQTACGHRPQKTACLAQSLADLCSRILATPTIDFTLTSLGKYVQSACRAIRSVRRIDAHQQDI